MQERKNPYFEAVEARTQDEADRYFERLLREVRESSAELAADLDHAREIVVANLCYVAGYYGEDARKRVGEFYSHRSPYRRPPAPSVTSPR